MKPILLIAILLVPAAPPSSGTADCERIEPVFGVTATGALVEQRFCVRAGHGEFLRPRPVAELAAGQTRQLFWGGMLEDTASAIYGVTGGGQLWWARQDATTGRLGAPIAVGGQFGDWSRYRQIVANGLGELFALDSSGHLLRWVHIGWREGEDAWEAGPQDLGEGCKLGPIVFASTLSPTMRYVALQDDPPGYAFCTTEGQAHNASVLPPPTRSATMAVAPGVAYALLDNGELARIVLGPALQWRAGNRSGASYLAAFAGWAFIPTESQPSYKYEWQWTFYDYGVL